MSCLYQFNKQLLVFNLVLIALFSFPKSEPVKSHLSKVRNQCFRNL